MQQPDLARLKKGDRAAWNDAFRWLYPTAMVVARNKLQPYLPCDVEDVALEAMEALIDYVPKLKRAEELKPMLAAISHNKAVDHLKKMYGEKRGGGRTTSLEALTDDEKSHYEPAADGTPVDDMEQAELTEYVHKLLDQLQPRCRGVLTDFFILGLKHREIAEKQGIAIGSVGVYLGRCLESIRKMAQK